MDKESKKIIIEANKQRWGKTYFDLPWFSKKNSKIANEQRKKLFNSLSEKLKYNDKGIMPHVGPLSPACKLCSKGEAWGYLITYQCTRNCFYCWHGCSPKKRNFLNKRFVKNATDHVNFLKIHNCKGEGFTGGEPLLVFDKLLNHIKNIRKKLNKIYIWLYTNGDLLNHKNLKKLKEVGLNEIRIDLAARKYDLAPLILAKKYIPKVTVEIPAIPEDLELLKKLLFKLESIGISHLNLIQLEVTPYNYRRLLRRKNYHLIHTPHNPMVFESDIFAIELISYAIDKKIKLPIHYCCYPFRTSKSAKNLFKKWLKKWHDFTDVGFIRVLTVVSSQKKINKMINNFRNKGYSSSFWNYNKEKNSIDININLLPFIDWSSSTLTINYYSPQIKKIDNSKGYTKDNLLFYNELIGNLSNCSKSMVIPWKKLYIKKINSNDIFKKHKLSKTEIKCLQTLSKWEKTEIGMQEIF